MEDSCDWCGGWNSHAHTQVSVLGRPRQGRGLVISLSPCSLPGLAVVLELLRMPPLRGAESVRVKGPPLLQLFEPVVFPKYLELKKL